MKTKAKQRTKKTLSITLLLLVCICMICELTGCAKKPTGLNNERGTNYKYDFVQFLDAHVYGSDGYGFLEIKPKELSASDFKSEQEYIAVKKAVDSLSLYVNPDNDSASSILLANKSKNLHNGDIVTLSINTNVDPTTLGVSMNLEPYKFEIKKLPKPKKIDIFDNSSVDFVGLDDGTTDIYPIKINGGKVPDDALEAINYTASTTEDKLQPNKTILTVGASLNPSVLNNQNKNATVADDEDDDDDDDDNDDNNMVNMSLTTYLGMKGYVAEVNGQKVLREIATPVKFTNGAPNTLQKQLTTFLRNSDPNFLSLANIQQKNDPDDSEKYDYTVAYYSKNPQALAEQKSESDDQSGQANSAAADTACMVATVKMADTAYAGTSVLSLTSQGSVTDDNVCSSGYADEDYTVKVNYVNSNSVAATPTPSASAQAQEDDDNLGPNSEEGSPTD